MLEELTQESIADIKKLELAQQQAKCQIDTLEQENQETEKR